MNDRADRLIDRAAIGASIVLLALFAGTLGTLIWPRLSGAVGIQPTPQVAYETGTAIDTPPEWYQGAPYTLMVFARASCTACQSAGPFFKRLIHDIGSTIRVVLVTSAGEADQDAEYARGLGLASQAIRTATRGLKVRVTPTLVLVNRQGTVVETWEGVGPPDKQMKIADSLTSRLASRPAAGPDTPSAAQNNR